MTRLCSNCCSRCASGNGRVKYIFKKNHCSDAFSGVVRNRLPVVARRNSRHIVMNHLIPKRSHGESRGRIIYIYIYILSSYVYQEQIRSHWAQDLKCFVTSVVIGSDRAWQRMTDQRRCTYCNRLCRYFGQEYTSRGWCKICQTRYKRNHFLWQRRCLAKESMSLPPGLGQCWDQTLQYLDNAGQEIGDIKDAVQRKIWERFLKGRCPSGDGSDGSVSSDDGSDIDEYTGFFPLQLYGQPFWTLFGLDATSATRYHRSIFADRVLHVVTEFLGPFTGFPI